VDESVDQGTAAPLEDVASAPLSEIEPLDLPVAPTASENELDDLGQTPDDTPANSLTV
jgi:hypothetical protein